ncbi:hypothetical protein WJX77_000896 [Trebouxia sp. C0004]
MLPRTGCLTVYDWGQLSLLRRVDRLDSCGLTDVPAAQQRHRHKVSMAPSGWKPSKYRVIEPTLAEDLVKHYPEKYSLPSEDQLEGLGEEDYARIVFVNREEAWIYIEYVDDADKVYGKLCDYMKCVDLHKNQRVWFHKDRIAEIKSEDDSE